MSLIQLVYASRPFGFDAGTLIGILFSSRVKNAAADITGCLICRDDLYLQLLEGPEENVLRTYDRIIRDDRHVEVAQLVNRPVSERMFGAWAMRDDPVQTWMWTRDQVDQGAVTTATPEEVLQVFSKLASQPPEMR